MPWVCAALDLLLFEMLLARGISFQTAHLVSFAAAGLAGLGFVAGPLWSRAFVLIGGVAAVLLRGGVLAVLVRGCHWPASVAIVPAIATAGLVIGVALWLRALPPGANRWRAIALSAAGYLALLRGLYMGQVELLPEESYYWNYAQHMDIGYLDHPPMVAWLIGAGTWFFGNTEFAVRLGAALCWFATAFFAFRLTRNLFDETSAWCAVLLVSAIPFFFGVAFVMTPDSPLTACWAASLYYFERALLGGRRTAWFGLGVAMGLGMLSKYSIGLVGLAGAAFLLIDPPSRRWFLRWEPYAAVLIAAVLFSPVLVWNVRTDWASFTYQGSRRLKADPRFSLHELLGSIVGVLTPTGLAATAIAWFSKREEADDRARALLFVKVFTAVPLAVFVFFSLRHTVKFSWTGPLWLAAVPALAWGMWRLSQRPLDRWVQAAWLPTVCVCVAVYGLFFHYLALGLPGLGYSEEMNLLPVGWRELARQVDATEEGLERESKTDPLVVGADRNFISSQLAFYDDDQPEGSRDTAGIHLFGRKALMYERWFPPAEQNGKTLLVVAFEERDLTRRALEQHTAQLGPVERGELIRDGKFVRHYYLRRAYDYRAEKEK